MRFLVLCFVAVFALSSAEDCSEERYEACVDTLMSAILVDPKEEEACQELEDAVDCLKRAVDECEPDNAEELEDSFKDLKLSLRIHCQGEDGDEIEDAVSEKIATCFPPNEKYFEQCITEGTEKALQGRYNTIEDEELSKNSLICSVYSLIADCYVERVMEKCGVVVGKIVAEEFEDYPKDVEEACESLDVPYLELLGEEKKK